MKCPNINSVALSEDASSFSVLLDTSFHVFTTDLVRKKYMEEFTNIKFGRIAITQDGTFIAFTGITIVDGTQKNKVFLWNNFYNECHSQFEFPEEVVDVVLKPKLLLIVLPKSVIGYDIQNKKIQFDRRTAPNQPGAADISQSFDDPVVACCGDDPGFVYIFHPFDSQIPSLTFHASEQSINMLKFSIDVSMIAVATEKGTIIRLYNCADGVELGAFKRGSFSSVLLSISFSPDNSGLMAVSGNGTIHVFDATSRTTNENELPRAISKMKIDVSKAASAMFTSSSEITLLSSAGYICRVKLVGNILEMDNKEYIF